MHALWYNGGTMKSPKLIAADTAIGRRGFLAGMAGTVAAAPAAALADSAGTPAKSRAGTVAYGRSLPVQVETDVFVAGGGAAGVAAAVAARSAGARVFLAEGFTCFGGMGTAARVPVFMRWGDGERDLACGFGTRFRDRLKRDGAMSDTNSALDFEIVKRAYDAEMLASGADFLFQTRVIDVVMSGDEISHAVVAAPSGMWAVRAKVYVDATGNGDVACGAGVPFEKGDATGHMMPASLLSAWDGIDWERWAKERPQRPQPFGAELARAAADGVFKEPDLHMTGLYSFPNGYATANIGHVFNLDGTDERSLTKGYIRGRESMKEYQRYFRDYLKRGLENVRLVETAAMMGVRETRRIAGDYVMTLEDYMKRAVFHDEIGRYSYPIDIHPSSADKSAYERHREEFDRLYRYRSGESYGIPYRILCAKGVKNLLTAGRCVSTDQKVQASIRVMPACYITGQAAGMAAAIAASGSCDVHAVDIKALQRKLVDFGAFLPNADA